MINLNLNEQELQAAIISKAVDEILHDDNRYRDLIAKEIDKRIEAIFSQTANEQIANAVSEAISDSLNKEYRRVDNYGDQYGDNTTIKKELNSLVSSFWTVKVDNQGKPSTYGSKTRAEYMMTKVCADDVYEQLKSHAVNITGSLKDGLRKQIGVHMDEMLNSMFRVNSLEDLGKKKKWHEE